jgi:hypothetical protein
MNQRIREARAEDESFEIQQEWVPLEEISDRLERAVITAEDGRFREHGGIDWLALASEVDWEGDEEFSWWSREDRRALWAAAGSQTSATAMIARQMGAMFRFAAMPASVGDDVRILSRGRGVVNWPARADLGRL